MKKIKFLCKINKNKYYYFNFIKNNKYNKYLKKLNLICNKNLDIRSEINSGDFILYNSNFKNRFIKCIK